MNNHKFYIGQKARVIDDKKENHLFPVGTIVIIVDKTGEANIAATRDEHWPMFDHQLEVVE